MKFTTLISATAIAGVSIVSTGPIASASSADRPTTAPESPEFHDCTAVLMVVADEGLWPAEYLTVGGRIDVDQRGAFASNADELAAVDWQSESGQRIGPRITRYFHTLSKARVYTPAFHRRELAFWSTPDMLEMCKDNSVG